MTMKVYTAEKAAKVMNVSIYTIRRWCKSGKLNAKNVGEGRYKHWRIPETAIAEFFDK